MTKKRGFKPGHEHISITQPDTREQISKTLRGRAQQGLPVGRPNLLENSDGTPNDLGKEVLEYAERGASAREIEKVLGVSKSVAHRFIKERLGY